MTIAMPLAAPLALAANPPLSAADHLRAMRTTAVRARRARRRSAIGARSGWAPTAIRRRRS